MRTEIYGTKHLIGNNKVLCHKPYALDWQKDGQDDSSFLDDGFIKFYVHPNLIIFFITLHM